MTGRRTAWLLIAMLAAACGGHETAAVQKEIDLGPHRIRVSTPPSWELLDQGAQQRFRKGESEIVLQSLGPATRRVTRDEVEEIRDLDPLADWGLAALTAPNDQRREVKSRQKIMIDNREAIDLETWNRLDHTWPQRLLFVPDRNRLLVLHTPRLADAETMKAFASIRDSLHFVESERR